MHSSPQKRYNQLYSFHCLGCIPNFRFAYPRSSYGYFQYAGSKVESQRPFLTVAMSLSNTSYAPFTREKADYLLGTKHWDYPPTSKYEEFRHPWSINDRTLSWVGRGDYGPFFGSVPAVSGPLMRVWDCMSGSQPDESYRMLARAPYEHLRTYEARRETLETHINHRHWTPTPYISFSSDPERLGLLARIRNAKGNRGSQSLVVIDPEVRRRCGLPFVGVAKEMQHYKIERPEHHRDADYSFGHYVCLWEVTPAEVVGHCAWDDIGDYNSWYKDIVIPAIRNFRARMTAERSKDCWCAWRALLSKSSHTAALTEADSIKGVARKPWSRTR